MRSLTALFVVALSVACTAPASAQHVDQKALEAVVRALHKSSDAPLIVSPRMVAPEVNGNVKIDAANQEALEDHLGAELAELEAVIDCADLARPESCSIQDGATIFQFFMPEPLQDGVLQIAVMLLKAGEGEAGQIKREWWSLALVRKPDVGWTVVDRKLQTTADGPW